MAIFTTRKAIKTRPDSVKVGYAVNDLESRMKGAAGGGAGVQPGAHPEFEAETPLEKVVNFGKKVAAKFSRKK